MTSDISGPTGRLHIDDNGSGDELPVLFVHAFGGSLVHWADQLAHLRPGRRAIGFDLRGHGRSDATVGPDDTIEDLAGDIDAVVEGLRLGRVVLVGHIIGGAAAVAYAGKRPQRVAGMLLVGTPGRVPLQQADQILSQMTSDYDATMSSYWDRLLADATPRVKDQITSEMGRMPQDVAMTLIKATFAYDPLPALQDYPGIVETVTIGDSPYDLHKQLPDAPDEHVDGTSHWVQMDKPEAFDRILDAFLARVDAAETAEGQDRKGGRLASLRR
jgi:pimeloyl-ACP methyl ester carboxylesterase